MEIKVARVISIDNILFLDVWNEERPDILSYHDDNDIFLTTQYEKALFLWKQSFKRFPVKEEFIENFKDLVNFGKMPSSIPEQLQQGTFIPVYNIELEIDCQEEIVGCKDKGCKCPIYAILNSSQYNEQEELWNELFCVINGGSNGKWYPQILERLKSTYLLVKK